MYNVYLLTCLPTYLLTYFCPQAMEDDRQNGRLPVVKAGSTLSIFLGAVSGRVFVDEVCSKDGKYFVYLAPIDKFGAACLKQLTGKYLGITAKLTRLSSERRHLPTFRNEEVVVQLPHADLVYVGSLAMHDWCVCVCVCVCGLRVCVVCVVCAGYSICQWIMTG